MSRAQSTNRVELKYCEGCGCLLTRPVGSGLTFCALCEAKVSEEQISLTLPKKRSLRNGIDLQGCADTSTYSALEVCA